MNYSKFNGIIILTISIIKLFSMCETTDTRKKIERFVNVNSDIYVTASLPDLRHSHHTSLRLGQCKRVYFQHFSNFCEEKTLTFGKL